MGETALLLGCQLDLEPRYDLSCQLILDGEDVGEIAIVPVGPQMATRGRIDQLGCDADAVAGLAHAAFEHVSVRATSGIDTALPLKTKVELRAITCNSDSFDKSVMMSSLMPSEK